MPGADEVLHRGARHADGVEDGGVPAAVLHERRAAENGGRRGAVRGDRAERPSAGRHVGHPGHGDDGRRGVRDDPPGHHVDALLRGGVDQEDVLVPEPQADVARRHVGQHHLWHAEGQRPHDVRRRRRPHRPRPRDDPVAPARRVQLQDLRRAGPADQVDGHRAGRGEDIVHLRARGREDLPERDVGPVDRGTEAEVHDQRRPAVLRHLLGQEPDLGALRVAHPGDDDRRRLAHGHLLEGRAARAAGTGRPPPPAPP